MPVRRHGFALFLRHSKKSLFAYIPIRDSLEAFRQGRQGAMVGIAYAAAIGVVLVAVATTVLDGIVAGVVLASLLTFVWRTK